MELVGSGSSDLLLRREPTDFATTEDQGYRHSRIGRVCFRKGPGRKRRLIYEFEGEASLSGLIAGLISASSVPGAAALNHRSRQRAGGSFALALLRDGER
jgi:hypothetical protein